MYKIQFYTRGDVIMIDERFIQERIAQLRIDKGASARDMSLTLGQSESYINGIENKKSLPSMPVFLYICEYFGITPKEFFDDSIENPARLNEAIEDLKKLDADALASVASVIKEILRKK